MKQKMPLFEVCKFFWLCGVAICCLTNISFSSLCLAISCYKKLFTFFIESCKCKLCKHLNSHVCTQKNMIPDNSMTEDFKPFWLRNFSFEANCWPKHLCFSKCFLVNSGSKQFRGGWRYRVQKRPFSCFFLCSMVLPDNVKLRLRQVQSQL